MSFDTNIVVRAATAARAAAAQNPAPFWVVAAIPVDGQPWINVIDAFGREDDARARLARLSIAPRAFAAVYASDGAGQVTLLDLWGPGYQKYDGRGHYGNEVVRAGADDGSNPPSWSRGARWGGLAGSPLGLVALGAAALGVGFFILRPGLKMMKADEALAKHLAKKPSESGQRAYWDAYTAKHRQ